METAKKPTAKPMTTIMGGLVVIQLVVSADGNKDDCTNAGYVIHRSKVSSNIYREVTTPRPLETVRVEYFVVWIVLKDTNPVEKSFFLTNSQLVQAFL